MINSLKGLRLVSLFSGIGGLDLAFINHGCKLIWANDNDKMAVKSYQQNVDKNIILGDLNEVYKDIPESDILVGGFPCQPFSLMGLQKGFNDERGTLFFTIEKILNLHPNKPKILVLENVRNLLSHDNGKTFKKMKSILEKMGYIVNAEILNTRDYGVPQTRRRVFVVCFHKSAFKEDSIFKYPKPIELKTSVFDLLDKEVDKKYFLSKKILPTILSNGSGNYYSKSTIDQSVAKPLTATMGKMHRANQDNYYTDDYNRAKFSDSEERRISNIRRLTVNECRKLQGFPDNWKQVVSDFQGYKQFGNAVSVNVSTYLADSIEDYLRNENNGI